MFPLLPLETTKSLAMKREVLYALACVLYLTGCSNNPSLEEVVNPEKEIYPVQFSIQMEKEVVSFPATRSMPDNTIPEPSVSKAEGDKELKELCTTIEYAVYQKTEEGDAPVYVKNKQFVCDASDKDIDFGIVYDSLPQGDYTFYFLAHNSKTATLSNSIFSFDNVSDTFYGALPLKIGAADEINKDITLERIVSRIEFMATDPISDELKQFDMEIDGVANQLNITTGLGIKTLEKQTLSYVFKSEDIGIVNKTHSFYTFIPATDNKIAVHLSAIAQSDELIRERQIDNILPEQNKIIRYKGRLYSRSESEDTFQISIFNNGEWGEEKEEELPE